jgi:hypothetical protein
MMCMVEREPRPEADVLEQSMPAGPEPETEMPVSISVAHVPEADALEQALPADHELLEDDE